MEKFDHIYQRAAERKGGEEELEVRLNKPASKEELLAISDDRWLAAFSQKVFQSGISWKVVRNKWPNFEELFFQFRIEPLLMLSDEEWEKRASDVRIIRHNAKVMSIAGNADMIYQTRIEHGSFAQFIANWPQDNITGLWQHLKKHGSRLGGNTGPYSLRQLGVDTFMLTPDVESYLRNTDIIDSGKNTKRAMQAADSAFATWREESSRSLTEISQIIAFSVGDNRF